MRCPACVKPTLALVKLRNTALELDRCSGCDGIWFDDKELCALFRTPDRKAFVVPSISMENDTLQCPRCLENLFECFYPKTQVTVNGCKKCQGIWVSAEGWSELLSYKKSIKQIQCPKCKKQQAKGNVCQYCGIVIANYHRAQQERGAIEGIVEQTFSDCVSLKVTQQLEWFEILSPFEINNRYDVTIISNRNKHGEVFEYSKSFLNLLGGQLLGSFRPANLSFKDIDGNVLLRLYKRFAIYFHSLTIIDSTGNCIGTIVRRFNLYRTCYDVLDDQGRVIFHIQGPVTIAFIRLNWNFAIEKNGENVGTITKKWQGLLQEAYSDADSFVARFDPALSLKEKILIFGAIFLIDFVHFEENQSD